MTAALATAGCARLDWHADRQALARVALLRQAEADFRGAYGKYGGLKELVRFWPETGERMVNHGDYARHRFTVSVTADGYTIHADLVRPGKGARRSFYCDQSGVIRGREGTAPADTASPPAR